MKKSTSASRIKRSLLESIDALMEKKEDFFENPKTDFSRIQKISLHDTMLFPMVISNEKTAVELLDYFPSNAIPSQSAMSYRRDQLKVSAYEALFKGFTSKLPQDRTFHGLHVIACDGTRVNTPYNPKDTDSFVDCIENRKGFNQYHLVTCYDVLNEVFTDAIIQGYHSMNEKLALCTMLDRYPADAPSLFVCDRGFASYNAISHVQRNGHFFLIRLTSPMAHKIFPDTQDIERADVLDIEDTYYVGRVRSKEHSQLKNYHFISVKRTYDSIPAGSMTLERFHLRLIKFPLPGGSYEYLLTNLLQEIFAKLTLYNFCTAAGQCREEKTSGSRKYKYVIEKTYLVKACIRFLKGQLVDVIELIKKERYRYVPEFIVFTPFTLQSGNICI